MVPIMLLVDEMREMIINHIGLLLSDPNGITMWYQKSKLKVRGIIYKIQLMLQRMKIDQQRMYKCYESLIR
jgi:hypothetical protein